MKFDGCSSKSNNSKFVKAVLIRAEKSTKLTEGLIYLGSSFPGYTGGLLPGGKCRLALATGVASIRLNW